MQPNNFLQLPHYSPVEENTTLLNKIILQLQRTRKLSESCNKLVPDKPVHSSNYIDANRPAFATKQDYLAELEGDLETGSCHFHFLHLYFSVAYGLLITPCCPYRQRHDGHYKLHKNKIHRFLCWVGCGLVLFRQFTIIRATWTRKFHHPTIFYFFLAHVHFHFVLTCIFYWSIHHNTEKLEWLLEKVSHCYLLSFSHDKRSKVWKLVIFFHVVFPLMGFLSPAVGHDVIDSWAWSPSWLFRSYVSKARFAFFLCTDVNLISIRPEWSTIGISDIIMTSFYILIILLNEMVSYMMSLIFGICSITLWTATNSFQQSAMLIISKRNLLLNNHTKMTVTCLYDDLKELSASINHVWGLFIVFYIIDIIPYLATDLDFGLRSMDWFDSLKMTRSVIFFAGIMIISAETYRKMQWFCSWLLHRENRDLFGGTSNELTLLVEELRTGPIGIGTTGFYQINYGLATQVCIIIITFFIITLQYADLHPNAQSWWT